MSFARPALVVGLSTVVSRILGLVRDGLLAAIVGAGPVADALLVAMRVPNLFRRILSEGGLNAGFVPLHARLVQDQGHEAAARFAGEALATLTLCLVLLLATVEIFAAGVVLLVASGYRHEPATLDLAVTLTRWCAPFVLAATLASLLAAVLNSRRHFTAAALAPVAAAAFVVAVLFGLAASGPGDPARAAWIAAAAVGVSGFVHLALVGAAVIRTPGALRLTRPRASAQTRRLLLTAGPVLAVSGAAQVMILASTQVASFTPGAVSWLYYADRLLQFPLGFVAVAVGVVLLPEIAARAAAGDHDGLRTALNRTLEAAFALSLPAAAALALLAEPLCRVLFERGAFGPADTRQTALVLQGLAPGLLAAVAGKVMAQLYFARHRVGQALAAAGAGVAATLAAGALLSAWFGSAGLGLGVSAGLTVHAALMAGAAVAQGAWRPDARLVRRFLRAGLAAAVMTGALALLLPVLGSAGSTVGQAAGLGLLCAAGLGVYALAAAAFGAVTREDLARLRGAPPGA